MCHVAPHHTLSTPAPCSTPPAAPSVSLLVCLSVGLSVSISVRLCVHVGVCLCVCVVVVLVIMLTMTIMMMIMMHTDHYTPPHCTWQHYYHTAPHHAASSPQAGAASVAVQCAVVAAGTLNTGVDQVLRGAMLVLVSSPGKLQPPVRLASRSAALQRWCSRAAARVRAARASLRVAPRGQQASLAAPRSDGCW